MSTNRNVDAVQGNQEFRSRVERDEPLTTHGHKPGVLASEADRAPEFHAQTLPAGSAPSESTHMPNPESEVSLAGSNPSALDTLPGATSSDVYQGYGHPGQGQTSSELRHDGQHTSKKQGTGIIGSGGRVDEKLDTLDTRQRGWNREEAGQNAGQRSDVPSAEERIPETAEFVAAENSGPNRTQRQYGN